MMHAVHVGPVASLGQQCCSWVWAPLAGQAVVPLLLGDAEAVSDLLLSHACRQEILTGGDPDEQHGTR